MAPYGDDDDIEGKGKSNCKAMMMIVVLMVIKNEEGKGVFTVMVGKRKIRRTGGNKVIMTV